MYLPHPCKGEAGIDLLEAEVYNQVLEINVVQHGHAWQLTYHGHFTIFWEGIMDFGVDSRIESEHFDGTIDEVAVHDKVLSTDEISRRVGQE